MLRIHISGNFSESMNFPEYQIIMCYPVYTYPINIYHTYDVFGMQLAKMLCKLLACFTATMVYSMNVKAPQRLLAA